MMTTRTGILALTFVCVFQMGCGFEHVAVGPERNDPISIEAGEATRADVELDIGAGKLNVGGGSQKLLDGSIDYNVDAWKPLVSHSTNGAHATVTIKQPSHTGGMGNAKYTWDLQLSDHVLTDLTVNCGAGQAQLNLGSVLLRSVKVHMGAGQVQLDLGGEPKHDYDVQINGGVGQADVRLPSGVGIWASAHGGIGSVNISGLEKHGDHWENDLYNKAKVTVKVEVNGGIGEIKIHG